MGKRQWIKIKAGKKNYKINLLDNYEELKTNVHIWVDGAFFNSEGIMYWIIVF